MSDDLRHRPLGVFDSGMGGLTVLRALHEQLPGEDIIYFGDTARVPYGTKGERTVRTFARQDAGLLVRLGVKLVVVACNTASAFALDYLRVTFPVPVLGVIDPGVETALERTRGGSVGVIGTSGTIRSRRYQEGLLAGRGQHVGLPVERILAQECPLFVPLVEEGMMGTQITRLALEQYLAPLRNADIDTLILGCTHYPLLAEDIGGFMGPEVTLVDSADALARAAAALLADRNLLRPPDHDATTEGGAGRLSFYLSDIPWKFAEIGERFLGQSIDDVKTVGLDEMEAAGQILPADMQE